MVKTENQNFMQEIERLRQTIEANSEERLELLKQVEDANNQHQNSNEGVQQNELHVLQLNELNKELSMVKTENQNFMQEIEDLRQTIEANSEERLKPVDGLNVQLQNGNEGDFDVLSEVKKELSMVKTENQNYIQEINNLQQEIEVNSQERSRLLKQLEDIQQDT